jgi:hypothetical protein
MDYLKREKNKDMEYLNIIMEIFIMVSLIRIIYMEKEFMS